MLTKFIIELLGDSRVPRYSGYVHGRSRAMLTYRANADRHEQSIAGWDGLWWLL